QLDLRAGGDITIAALERVAKDKSGRNSFETVMIDGVGALTVTNPNASLFAAAGGDFNLQAGSIEAQGADADINLQAAGSINIDPATVRQRSAIVWDARNFRRDSVSTDIGATIAGSADVNLTAGDSINLTAASIDIDGDLRASAGKDIQIKAGQQNLTQHEEHYSKGGGLLKKVSRQTLHTIDNRDVISSQVSAENVELVAGRDLNVQGSHVVADNAVRLTAANNIGINAAQGHSHRVEFEKKKKSGVFSGGSFGVSVGSQRRSESIDSQQGYLSGNTLGSLEGDVAVNAEKAVNVTASELLSQQGDIRIEGENVTLDSGNETLQREQIIKLKQSGVTLALSGGAVDTVNTIQNSVERINNTDNSKLQALQAWRAGRSAEQLEQGISNLGNIGNDFANPLNANNGEGSQSSGVNVSISLGSSQSEQINRINNTEALG
ncbi:MAG: hemagglutinin repeat-containing protein, partial [Cellvibrionaceae bacterium]|nr:hemagglutinin repeat-containing protein [Cellvibrionaceae bacterium]